MVASLEGLSLQKLLSFWLHFCIFFKTSLLSTLSNLHTHTYTDIDKDIDRDGNGWINMEMVDKKLNK